jgi:HAD superfamily hydrolase (TIGR01509 family)
VIKAIIFDFFDVIRQDAFHAWMRNHNYTRDDAPGDVSRRLDIGQINVEQFFQELAQISGQSLAELKLEFSKNEVFDQNVIDLIRRLKSKYVIALLSNSESLYLRNLLKENDIESLFDHVFISSEIGIAKPNKEIFEYALKQLSLDAGEVVFIDDQVRNIEAAESVGISGIVFKNAAQLEAELNKITGV